MQHSATYGMADGLSKPDAPKVFGLRRYKRLNALAPVFATFAPWLVFVLISGMLSFRMHYQQPLLCHLLSVLLLLVVGVPWGAEARRKYALIGRPHVDGAHDALPRTTWWFFVLTTALLSLVAAIIVGNKNFAMNMQPYFDVANLNTYAEVNPATVRGEELMDAGLTSFVVGSRIDLKYAMNFRNSESYCVAPITLADTAPLSSYDYWAVGKNCCSESSSEAPGSSPMAATEIRRTTRWWCPFANSTRARGGLRAMRNEDRPFFRLAVQQAQSVFNIRAAHPLFFYWVEDPAAEAYSYMLKGYRVFLIGMFVSFAVQLLLVGMVSACFVDEPFLAA